MLGAQQPRLHSVPTGSSSAGPAAVKLAAAAGINLDPWQALVLDGALAERPDLRWQSRETALIVPRQNGKGEVLVARELAGLLLFGEQRIVHTAHLFKTAKDAFMRLKFALERLPEGSGRSSTAATRTSRWCCRPARR